MSYTAQDFRKELENELRKGYDVVRIARAAFQVYFEHTRELAPDLEQKVFQIVAMEEGPEFELSEQQLWEFAKNLTGDPDHGEEERDENAGQV
jgi:hypothetical protein